VTLETGIGLSTALFVILGCHHTCVAPDEGEWDRLFEYFRQRGIDASKLVPMKQDSAQYLPSASAHELDLLFIDGNHGFPIPIVDWYYGARFVRVGGVVVLDDVHIRTVRTLVEYLDVDPNWRRIAGNANWKAYERLTSHPLGDDFYMQEFYQPFDHRTLTRRTRDRVARAMHRTPSRSRRTDRCS
jgi:predicted O-methyltransferase YrrM